MHRSRLPALQRLFESSYKLCAEIGQGADCWRSQVLAIQRVKNGGTRLLRLYESMFDETPEGSIDARLRSSPDQFGYFPPGEGPASASKDHQHLAFKCRANSAIGATEVHRGTNVMR